MFLLLAPQGVNAAGAGGAGAAANLGRKKQKTYDQTEGPLKIADRIDEITEQTNLALIGKISVATSGTAFPKWAKDPNNQVLVGQLANTEFSGAWNGKTVTTNTCYNYTVDLKKRLKDKKITANMDPQERDYLTRRNEADSSIAQAVTYLLNGKTKKAAGSVKTTCKALSKTVKCKGVGRDERKDIIRRAAGLEALKRTAANEFASAVDDKVINIARKYDPALFEQEQNEFAQKIQSVKQTPGPQPSVN